MMLSPSPSPSPSMSKYQQKYRHEWHRSVLFEQSVKLNLRQLLALTEEDIISIGKGTMSTDLIFDPVESPPDFYIPLFRLFVEVTSSDLSLFASYSRCRALKTEDGRPLPPCPHLFIRWGKVRSAKEQRRLSRTIFASVNFVDGSITYFPANKADEYPLVYGYEPEGDEPYYAIPWSEWWKPGKLRDWLVRGFER